MGSLKKGIMTKFSVHDRIIRSQEPDMTQIDPVREDYRARFADALNWVSYIFTTKELRDIYVSYNRAHGPVIPHMDQVDDWLFVGPGKTAYILDKGGKVSDQALKFFTDGINRVRAEAKRIGEALAAVRKKPVVSAEHLLWVQVVTVTQRIEDLILTRTYDPTEGQVIAIMRDAALGKSAVQQVVDGLTQLRREVTDKSVPDYAENIELMGPRAKYVGDCLTDALKQISLESTNVAASKKPRKARTMKERSAERLTQNIKHKKIDSDMNVVSIDPTQIIGARQLVVYNTKSKRVGIYVANDNDTLSIRGTTLQNYTEATSFAKTLRRPEEDLVHFRTAANPNRIDVLLRTNIRGKTFPMNGRSALPISVWF